MARGVVPSGGQRMCCASAAAVGALPDCPHAIDLIDLIWTITSPALESAKRSNEDEIASVEPVLFRGALAWRRSADHSMRAATLISLLAPCCLAWQAGAKLPRLPSSPALSRRLGSEIAQPPNLAAALTALMLAGTHSAGQAATLCTQAVAATLCNQAIVRCHLRDQVRRCQRLQRR